MQTEDEAAEQAEAYNRQRKLLGLRSWKGQGFAGGWLMMPQGEDLIGYTGVVCLVVLDDGRIFHENSSMASDWIIARYLDTPSAAVAPAAPVDEATAAARAADYNNRHLGGLGLRTWTGERFAGGWRMVPEGDDLTWQFGVVCLMVLDDGRIFEDSASTPPDWAVQKYIEMMAREADGTQRVVR